MPWFVVYEIVPDTAFGIWERKGLSSTAESKEDSIIEVEKALSLKYKGVRIVDTFQYEENEY